MKTKKAVKAISSILLIILQLISLGFLGYALILYKGVETFYRIFGLLALFYLFILNSYLLLNSIKKKKKKSFIIPAIFSIIFIVIQFGGFYYLNKIYKTIDTYSDKNNMYYSSLVSYNLDLKSYKDLNKAKIGIINDTSEIEGYILPNEIIKNLKLDKNNTIKKYNSTMELLYALKTKELDAAFFSSNYVDMFYSLDGYEDIEKETVVLYETSKEYKTNEKEIESSSSLDKPFTMLLIGVDSSKDGVTSGYNADVLLLATFNPNTLRATLTSVPRDMYLKTACSGNTYRRINTVTWGSSADCAVKTMENLFDVDIDYYAKINFKGVVQLVNSVNGIDVDVPYSLCEQNSSRKWGNKSTIYVEKGKQHLNGEQALALARNRHSPTDSKMMAKYCPTFTEGVRNDYTRGKNQMKVILGIIEAATKLRDPNQAVDILEKVKANFQTNVKSKDVLSLYNLGKSLIVSDNSNLINIQRMQLSGYDAWHYIYEPSSNSYPAVIIPYKDSIKDIKAEINNNLNNKSIEAVKTISFNLNKLYEDKVIGQKKYSQSKIPVLKSLAGYTVSNIKSYASSNNLKLTFKDVDTNKSVNISDWSNYTFYSQKEHVDTILEQLSSLTIYVKKKAVVSTPKTNTTNDTDNTTNNTEQTEEPVQQEVTE